MDLMRAKVINAAGKLTALGGSAQSQSVAETQAVAAQMHFDMDVLRREVAAEIADYCGAEAACVTSGEGPRAASRGTVDGHQGSCAWSPGTCLG